MARDEIGLVIAKQGLTLTTVFVPFSQSRSAGSKHPTLNWRVTLHKQGKPVLTTDYSAGCAHCPSHKQGDETVRHWNKVQFECEHGYKAHADSSGELTISGKPLQPDIHDVLCCLNSDADTIEHDSFEEWCGDMGYDEDSRKAEAIYRAGLEIALLLRNRLGDKGLSELREACEGY